MRAWREDRLLRVVEVAAMLDVEEDVLDGWEDGVGLPEDTQELAMRYRSLQTAAGEEHHDIVLADGSVVYGMTKVELQGVWQRYMTRAAEREQARMERAEAKTQAGARERDSEFDQGEAPDDTNQTFRRGGGGGRRGGFRRRK